MRALGTLIPRFTLKDVVTGKDLRMDPAQVQNPILVIFICCHCPYVIHIESGLSKLAEDYARTDLKIIAICSNDQNMYPQDAPDRMREQAVRLGWTFPYLHDETQEVAKAFDAACTPDFFLFDRAGRLVYRGQFDDSRPGNNLPITGEDLRAAIDATLSGKEITAIQKPSIGCSIKWRPPHAPYRERK
jgi:thiol-disulfide isomerase/thioredoxin